MHKFNVGDKVQSKRCTELKGIIMYCYSNPNAYRVKVGAVNYNFNESNIELVQIESENTSGSQLKIGDHVYHYYDKNRTGVIKEFNSNGYAKVVSHNATYMHWVGNLRLIKAESQDEQYNKDSFNYAVDNLQPEVSQNIESVMCDCGITSANVGGNHSQWCKRAGQ